MTADERQRQLASFDYIWQTIHDKHWETKPGGLDWDAVRAELRPRAEKAQNANEVRELMREMLQRLKQSHFHLISAEAMGNLNDVMAGEGQPGFEVELVNKTALVSKVEPGVSVKTGWRLLTVDGVSIDQRIAAVSAAYAGTSELDLRMHQMFEARLSGTTMMRKSFEFLDAAGKKVAYEATLRQPNGKMASFGNLPPMPVEMESRMLEGKIGYVRFTLFLDPVRLTQTFAAIVRDCASCAGFIIDVRGNPGGIGILATGVAGWFVDQSNVRLGSMYTRDSTLNFVVNPRPQAFAGPLAILVDGASASTSEIFAGGMQDIHRARVFGTRTAAAALPSVVERLPNGDGFQYAIANYISEGGKALEGRGVQPDEEVRPTRETLLAGRDAVLDAAVAWIQKKDKK